MAETCSCALRTVNSIPPNVQLCLTIYAYILQFEELKKLYIFEPTHPTAKLTNKRSLASWKEQVLYSRFSSLTAKRRDTVRGGRGTC